MQEALLHLLPLAAVLGYILATYGYVNALRQRGAESMRLPRCAGIVGCICHVGFLAVIAVAPGVGVLQLFFELPATLSLMSALLLVLFFSLERRAHISGLGVVVAPVALALMLWSSVAFHLHRTDAEATKVNWLLLFHWSAMVLGFAMLVFAFAVSVGVIVHETSMKRKRFNMLQQKLPPLVLLDRLQFQLLCLGLLFAASGVGVGLLIGEKQQTHYVKYDPGIVTALLTLLVYSITILTQLIKGWRGKRAAWLSVCGFGGLVIYMLCMSLSTGGFHVF